MRPHVAKIRIYKLGDLLLDLAQLRNALAVLECVLINAKVESSTKKSKHPLLRHIEPFELVQLLNQLSFELSNVTDVVGEAMDLIHAPSSVGIAKLDASGAEYHAV